jgi:hypothetical protein
MPRLTVQGTLTERGKATTFPVPLKAVTHPDLADWMDRYGRHRPELRRMLIAHPTVLAKVAAFVQAHHRIATGGTSAVIPAGLVKDWLALTSAARKLSSPELASLLGDVDAVMEASSGHTLRGAPQLAAAHRTVPTASH